MFNILGSNCKPSSSNQPPSDDSDDEPSAGSNDPPKNQDNKQKKQPKNTINQRVVVMGKGKYAGTKYVGGAENQPHVHYYDKSESDGHVKIGTYNKSMIYIPTCVYHIIFRRRQIQDK